MRPVRGGLSPTFYWEVPSLRWKGGRRSTNVDDRRGRSIGGAAIGGGTVILALLAALVFGVDPGTVTDILGGAQPQQQEPPAEGGVQEDTNAEFARVVKGSLEDIWGQIHTQSGARYQPATLVFYDQVVRSACGTNSAATGPFYCPGDQSIYLDLSFLNELKQLGAPGDFAFAYVIAHEVGHHIQRLSGTAQQVGQLQRQAGESGRNALSVLMELQADCYAGVWAHHVNRSSDEVALEPGDVDEGLRAAAAIGDDRLQAMAGQSVQPESFTHGTSEQRARWLRTGLETGDANACDTFGQAGL